ncbi:hypothetical protein JVU11DRAFT_7894 [Chiua virens]|nr:hypothetical protein JVU11DRAFT_7894 [Chiua virens]
MFNRPEFLRPFNLYSRSRSPSPARVRIAVHEAPSESNPSQGHNFTATRSPAPTLASGSPQSRLFDGASPTRSVPLAHLFAGARLGSESPQRQSSPAPMHPPEVADVRPTQPSTPKPDLFTHSRTKRGPKHPSFTKIGRRSSLLSRPYTLPELERDRRKKPQERERRKVQNIPGTYPDETFTISLDELEKLSGDQEMEHETHPDKTDKIALDQLEKLEQEWEHEVAQCRQRIARAYEKMPQRMREHVARDNQVEKMWEEGHDEEEAQSQHQRKLEEQRQCTYKEQERKIREEQDSILHEPDRLYQAWVQRERKKLVEVECLLQAEKNDRERSRLDREDIMRSIREQLDSLTQKDHDQCEEIERLRKEELVHFVWREEQESLAREQQERFVREQQERLARESKERFVKWMQERFAREQQERERQARQTARSEEEQIRQQFTIYEAKWQELQMTNTILPPIHAHEIPWPVLGVVSSAEQITYQDVRAFLFHPLRPDMQGKSARDKVKSEALRFHPDKFNARVASRIQGVQQAVAKEIAGVITMILTRLMTEAQTDGEYM